MRAQNKKPRLSPGLAAKLGPLEAERQTPEGTDALEVRAVDPRVQILDAAAQRPVLGQGKVSASARDHGELVLRNRPVDEVGVAEDYVGIRAEEPSLRNSPIRRGATPAGYTYGDVDYCLCSADIPKPQLSPQSP